MRQDRHSRQVGRALAAVAASDRHLRRGPCGLVLRSLRRALFLAPVVAGAAVLVVEDDKLPEAVVQQREKVLDAIFA